MGWQEERDGPDDGEDGGGIRRLIFFRREEDTKGRAHPEFLMEDYFGGIMLFAVDSTIIDYFGAISDYSGRLV